MIMLNKNTGLALLIGLFSGTFFINSEAQSYNALNGSAYSGVLGNFVNPASAVNTPFEWDYSLFGFQTNTSNNGVSISNLTWSNLTPKNINNIIIQPTTGTGSRTIDNCSDFHLLNFRYSLDQTQSVSFGMRVRTCNHIWASPFNYSPEVKDFNSFLTYNADRGSVPFNINITNEAWSETDFGYSRIVLDNEERRISVGGTLQILRGLSGVAENMYDVTYQSQPNRNIITSGGLTNIYSANYSAMDSQYTPFQNLKRFKGAAKYGIGASFGIEYIVKKNVFDESFSTENYYWKFGASIMDIGHNNFGTNVLSFDINTPNPGLSDTLLNNKFHSPYDSVRNITNALWSTFSNAKRLQTKFTMSLPTRLVLTIDKSLGNDFYINLMGNINFYSQDITDIYHIKTAELNRLTLTPRWETEHRGIYIPIEFTERNQLVLGAAVKFGPLIFGLHNITWLNRYNLEEFEGGGYLALHFTPNLNKMHHFLDCFDGKYKNKTE